MPGGDGTGPGGLGPMTGRAAGYCAGYSVPGYMNPIAGRGYFGRGYFGGGRGMGRGGGRGRSWGLGFGRGFGWGGAYPYGAGYYGIPYAGSYSGLPYANPYAGSYYGAPYAGAPYAAPYTYPYNPGNPEITSQQEAGMLKEQAKAMQGEINSINQRITELESADKTEQK